MKNVNGDVTKWCTFWDAYEASIHKNASIATIDKFKYLNSLLEKSAGEAIAGMLLKVLQEELEARERAVGAPNNYSPARNSPSRKMVSIGMILLQPQHSPLRHAPLQPVPIVYNLMPPASARQ